MQEGSPISAEVLFHWGPIELSVTVLTTWGLMLLLALFVVVAGRRLRIEGGRLQTGLEIVVQMMENAIHEVAPDHTRLLLPFIGTLWVYLVLSNLVGLIPGLHSPTRDLSTTSGLAILVFLSVHWYGIRDQGLKAYLKHYLEPSPVLLPFTLISEVTRTVALAVRLFGNMMSLELTAVLVLVVAGFLAPIPILMLHIVEALVQAYIFGMLALIYVAGGLQSQQLRMQNKE